MIEQTSVISCLMFLSKYIRIIEGFLKLQQQ